MRLRSLTRLPVPSLLTAARPTLPFAFARTMSSAPAEKKARTTEVRPRSPALPSHLRAPPACLPFSTTSSQPELTCSLDGVSDS